MIAGICIKLVPKKNLYGFLGKPEGYYWSHWHEKIVFLRQFIDVLNPFIGCHQNWSKIQYLSCNKNSVQITFREQFKCKQKMIIGPICYSKHILFFSHPTHKILFE